MKKTFIDEQFGSDVNEGTIESPFKTFGHAWAVHNPGEIIYVLPPIESRTELITGRKTFSPIKEAECPDPKQNMSLMRI